MAEDEKTREHHTVGLCASCRHVRRVRSRKGSTFYMCKLSETDNRFVKYPPLPVRSCPGYESEPVNPEKE